MPQRESLLPQFKLLSRRSALGLCFAVGSAVLQLSLGARYLSVTVIALLFLFIGTISFSLPAKWKTPALVLSLLCAAFISFWMSQACQSARLSYLSADKLLLGILLCAIILLFFLLLTARPFAGVCIGMVLIMLLATLNFYVFKFRGTELMPSDLLSFATARDVMGDYDFTPNLNLVRAWLAVLMFLFALSALHLEKLPRLRLTLVSVPLLAVMIVSLLFGARSCEPYFFSRQGTYMNGFLLNFSLSFQQSFVSKPDAYDPARLRELSAETEDEDEDAASAHPTIIAIMNESFADLSFIGSNLRTDEEFMPFIRSLKENTIKGYACSSVFGGNTANSEFEFLTGHSMAFLPSGSIPYQQYLSDGCYSMVSALKQQGYACVAMTPWVPTGWNLRQAYKDMGFDETHFIDDFGDISLVRDRPSDRGMYEYLIRRYEQRDKDSPLFLFGVTMQNHSSYTYDNALYPSVIHLKDSPQSFPEVEQYLTLIHESDAALADLVAYFSGVDEEVVIVFFGDHLPFLPTAFYQMLHDAPTDSLDEMEKERAVPYLIWTNYDSPAQTPPLTSLNYLSNYVYEAAGLPLPAYNQLLRRFQQTAPVVNSLGYYSPSAGRFLPLEEAQREEAETLSLYRQLEYNALFDAKNRLPIFETRSSK